MKRDDASGHHGSDCPVHVPRRCRATTPRSSFLQCCDEKLTEEDDSEAITGSATSCYDNDDLNDYVDEFGNDVESTRDGSAGSGAVNKGK